MDESADARLGPFLRRLGHDVATIAVDHPASLKDEDVLAIARREQRILITDDRDFGELVFRNRRPHAGVMPVSSTCESARMRSLISSASASKTRCAATPTISTSSSSSPAIEFAFDVNNSIAGFGQRRSDRERRVEVAAGATRADCFGSHLDHGNERRN